MILHGHELGPTVPLGRVLHLGELPGVHRTRPDVAHLARLHQVVQGLHGLLDRGVRVVAVDLVEVDVVGAEAAEAVVDLGHDRLAGQAVRVGSRPHPPVHLGREHDLVTPGEVGERPADDLLAGAVGVDVGGVEEVDPGLQRLPDQRARGLLVEGPLVHAPVGQTVGHAAQTDPRDVQARRTELHVLHRCRSCLRDGFQGSVTTPPATGARRRRPSATAPGSPAKPAARPGPTHPSRSSALSHPKSGRVPSCPGSPEYGSPNLTPIPRSRMRLSW